MASANALILTKRLADAYFTGTFKFLLVTSVPSESDFDTFDFRSDITNEHAATGGYTTGGVAVTVTVGSVDTTNDRTPVTVADVPSAFTSATISAVGGWLYKVIGSAATDELVGFVDFGGTVSSTAGTFGLDFVTPLYVNG